MKIIRHILLAISIILFGWLFTSNFYHIDLKPILSHANFREEILKVENSDNIDELKEFTKNKMFQYQRLNIEESKRVEKSLYIIFLLIAIQLFLYFSSDKSVKK